jgi:hypothetical protein
LGLRDGPSEEMAMAKQITLKRDGNRIAFLVDGLGCLNGATEVASLYDGQSQIIFDTYADPEIYLGTATDWPTHFAAIGLDAETARDIDAAPVPGVSI